MKNPTEIQSFPPRKDIEKALARLLKKDTDPYQIFEKIRAKADIYETGRFLYNACMDKTLFEWSLDLLKKDKSPAWPFFLKLLEKYNIRLGEKQERMIFHSYLKKSPSSSLFACKEWAEISPEFRQMRLVYMQEIEKKSFSKEQDLLEQLKFAQAQQLIEEEEKIIRDLLAIQSENISYQNLQKELMEKKALLLIEKQKEQIKKSGKSAPLHPVFKQKPLKGEWRKAVFQLAQESPKHTKNLSFFLYFCGWPKEALEIFSQHVANPKDHWFFLDWMFETGQNTKGLELIHQICRNKKDSAGLIPLMYIKARMLYALGQKKQAVEYMAPIAKARPDYKSAAYFLDLWLKSSD